MLILNKSEAHPVFERPAWEKTKRERGRERETESPMISAKDGEGIWRWHRLSAARRGAAASRSLAFFMMENCRVMSHIIAPSWNFASPRFSSLCPDRKGGFAVAWESCDESGAEILQVSAA